MHVSFIPLSLLAARALADGAAIVAAMTTISEATVALNSTVTSFPSNPLLDLLDVGPLLTDSLTLLNDINSATATAQKSANLTISEVVAVAEATLSLASTVESVLTNIVNSKPKFDKLVVVSPVILLNLKSEKSATDKFGAAVVAKVPTAFQTTAQNLLAPIDAAFNSAIATYEQFAIRGRARR
ncbi:hypothetical protein NA56DRAFT_583345 [Hyaloscypha hepaticicola]|uniref:Antigenic cell wall galactomanno protein n=1 Tax=Hyaloscypha hepaticicola TaxID=2082293 RepID=A0A2J6PKU0_9HELO|nr:hypothetical protein NA56DRAFT_583345 [Hyaloscypha hepaticicola]